MKKLAVIILNYNTKKLTLQCLKSLSKVKSQIDYQVIVVDNDSDDGSVEAVKTIYPNVKIIANKSNVGFARGNNLALKQIVDQYEYSLLLNSDTIVLPQSINQLVNFADRNEYTIASCRLLNSDHTFQPNAGRLPNFLNVFFWLSGLDDIFGRLISLPSYQERGKKYYRQSRQVGWVSGSVMLLRNSRLKRIGFLDGRIFMYGEDVDLCWRAKKMGFSVGWLRGAKIIHLGGGSMIEPQYFQWLGEFNGLIYLYQKHYGRFAASILKFFIHLFVSLRVIAFSVVGKPAYAKTYVKILRHLK